MPTKHQQIRSDIPRLTPAQAASNARREGVAPAPKHRFASPLALYLSVNNCSQRWMSRALGVSLETIQRLCAGDRLPTLPMAYEIERVTKGVVPTEVWMGTVIAKEQLVQMRAKQPEGIKSIPPTLMAVAPGQHQKARDVNGAQKHERYNPDYDDPMRQPREKVQEEEEEEEEESDDEP